MGFKSAKNFQRSLRMAIVGPAKSGKSWTALTIAHALAGENGRVAVIDTENASASKYAEQFPPFDVCELEQFNPDSYVHEIKEAERLGYDVLIVDSLTHAWNGPGGLLETKHLIAKSGRPGMNDYTAWAEVTPKQNALVYAITHAKMHIIATMRTKMEYSAEQVGGKLKVTRLGLAPIQRDETEYEFDILALMDKEHSMTIDGSRCPTLDHVEIPRPDGSIAETIKAWLAGEPLPEPTRQQVEMRALLQDFYNLSPATYARITNWEIMALRAGLGIKQGSLPTDYSDEQVEMMRAYVASRRAEKEAKEARAS
jgi:KaiC/GvpD/RAD55 family RecA-like ATPase